ncbi:AbiEi antitoxin N-terminal domain-containing protein [Iodidimonas gelatinilytica]|uniref:AbiEi antitoxin N-terminal domain-containing protein n=1 Tax=Iodidimonas gelatinilytica TaxID=1236966 RepID=UPI001B2FEE12|nr:AbiEi antitoxin N-terminal domain-containing protein [Iodidimonas gelatinilytica]
MFAMIEQKSTKIKALLSSVPSGGLVDSAWLTRHNMARPTVHGYVKRGWLKRLAHGVYLRPASTYDPDQPLSWQAVAVSMHMIMEIPFHVGSMTALSLHGQGHYAQMSGAGHITLYAEKLPSWLFKIKVDGKFSERSLKLFSDPKLGVEPLKNTGFSFGGDLSFPVSSPERAILERSMNCRKVQDLISSIWCSRGLRA